MTTAEARSLVKSNPSAYRAAFVEAPGAPLLDHPQARVTLYEKVGHAQDELRAKKESLVKSGWKQIRGSMTWGYFVFEREGETRAMCIDKVTRKRG